MNHDAVLLVGFGAPETQADVEPFVRAIVAGRGVPEDRIREVVSHYEAIGGGSPYNGQVADLAASLTERLAADGATRSLRVYTGMRQWRPYLKDVIARMAADGVMRARAIVLAPHRCEASWDRYVAACEDARAAAGPRAPALDFAPSWHTDPLFVGALADRTNESLILIDPEEARTAFTIFTAHSVPQAMKGAASYAAEFRETCEAVARKLDLAHWALAYQSRSGAPNDPWLSPSVEEALDAAAHDEAATAVIVPVGFLSDHVEVLYDLDHEAAEHAQKLGLSVSRALTVGTHPSFVSLLAALAAR